MQASGLGQALEGVKAIASLAGGAVVLWVVYAVGGIYLTDASSKAPGGYGGVAANDWINVGLDQVLPLAYLSLVFFGLVASAVLSRRWVR